MDEKKGHSEDKESFLGENYKQHYDNDGKKNGWSEVEESFFGEKYTQHHDENDNRTGKSKVKETFWGDKYIQKYDEKGNKIGYSEEKTTFLGSEYTQHYDQDGNEIGATEEKETFLGKNYDQHTEKKPPKFPKTKNNKDSFNNWVSDQNWVIQLLVTVGILFLFIFVISAVIIALLFCLAMVVISSIATFIIAEGLKKNQEWAKKIYSEYPDKIIWFGPSISAICLLITSLIMSANGIVFDSVSIIIFLIFGALGFYASKLVSIMIFRWRMKKAIA